MDMTPEAATRFRRGEGCPSCGFGGRCPSCDGCGREARYLLPRCATCSDKGYIPAWSPQRSTRGFQAGSIYTGYQPKVRTLSDQGPRVTLGVRNLPERMGEFLSADGLVHEWWVACPEGCATQEPASPCSTCSGTGMLTVADPDVVALDAAKTAIDASDEDPVHILVERGLL